MHCIASRFPTTLNYIAESNFYGSRSLVSLTSLAQQPPLAEPDIFGESAATESATLYVPDASLDAYKSADVWKDFFSIKGVSSTGISTTTSTDSVRDIYSLTGRKLSKPTKGVNIVRMSSGRNVVMIKK
ncbi:MAG: hypothetical protein ACI3YZ_01160 [Prevotella sp.]